MSVQLNNRSNDMCQIANDVHGWTLHRYSVKHKSTDDCKWCADPGKSLKDGSFRLFRYEVETATGRKLGKSKLFCSKSCFDLYSGPDAWGN